MFDLMGGTDGSREKGPSSYQAICWFHAHGHLETSPVTQFNCVSPINIAVN